MNLYDELDRLTEPEFAASPVRHLTPEEIAEVEAQILPPGTRSQLSRMPRLIVPPKWGRGSYGYRPGR